MTTQTPSATYNVDHLTTVVPAELHVLWCTCGVAAGGARMPNPNCAMHSGHEAITWGAVHWTA